MSPGNMFMFVIIPASSKVAAASLPAPESISPCLVTTWWLAVNPLSSAITSNPSDDSASPSACAFETISAAYESPNSSNSDSAIALPATWCRW